MDSGAGVSVVTKQFINYLKAAIDPNNDERTKPVLMANGDRQTVLGTVSLNVKINDAETPFNFIVLPYMSQEVILGADFMDTYACNIDFASKTISFFNGRVSIEVSRPTGTQKSKSQSCF